MLDLCRFKEVNDTLGHNVGDRVLCEVAQRFRQALGDRGFIARIGGDEFTVVVDRPHSTETIANTSQALVDSLRVRHRRRRNFHRSRREHRHRAFSAGRQRSADAAAPRRRRHVRGQAPRRAYEFYDAAHDENTVRKLAIGGELRSAIASQQLSCISSRR